MARMFGFAPLPPSLLLGVLLIVLSYVTATEVTKR